MEAGTDIRTGVDPELLQQEKSIQQQLDATQARVLQLYTRIALSRYNEKGEPTYKDLFLGDIFNLKLPAELVVLSACQTGLGKNVGGEVITGFTRGFMYAGSKQVAVSLWNVKDTATYLLMKNFYQKMLERKLKPSQALRETQLEMWKKGQSPYYWAGFTIQGEWR